MLAGACGLLGLLVVLEVSDLRRSAARAAPGSRLGWPAIAFLAAVAAVYCGLEAAVTWVGPHPSQILESCRLVVAGISSAPAAGSPSPVAECELGIIVFYLAGFWDYVVHRGFSHSRWFWFTHEYHHLPRQVCLFMPGILGRPFAAIPSALTVGGTAGSLYTAIYVLRVPLWDLGGVLPVLLVIAVILTASHSSFLRRFACVHQVLRWACITTPHEHLLHHAADRSGNYGNFTTLWDRIFQTYLDPAGVNLAEVRLGLSYDQDFLGALTGGWLKLPSGWRDRFQLSYSCAIDPQQDGA